jgi:hypothetical protein
MPIKLPDLADVGALRLIACGRISTRHRHLASWLDQRRVLVCSYSAGNSKFFARLLTGGSRGHFHIECAAANAFSRSNRPKPNTNRRDFDGLTERVIGQQIDVRFRCYFVIPLADLAPNGIIRSLSSETTAAGVSMKLTSGVLTLSSSPIDRIEWTILNSDNIQVGLEKILSRTLAESYLVELLRWSRSLFDVMILNRGTQANA